MVLSTSDYPGPSKCWRELNGAGCQLLVSDDDGLGGRGSAGVVGVVAGVVLRVWRGWRG